MKKSIVGCATAGAGSRIGRIFQVMVATTPTYFKKHIPKDAKEAVKFAEEAGGFMVINISPETFKGNKHIVYGIMELLNTIPEFWERNINILHNTDKKEFIDNLNLTDGLKRVNIDFKKWNIVVEDSDQYVPKVCQLAKKVAEYYRAEEMEYIKTVYGDYKTEEEFIEKNPGIIHIRGNGK